MEDSLKNTIFAFVLIGLFGMLILTAVVEFGGTYDMNTSEVVGGSLSIDKFNNSINNIETNSKALKERFDKGSIWSAIAGIVVEGIFGIAKDMLVMIFTPFNLVSNILSDVFLVPVWVTSVLLGLLILGIIFGIWSLLKIGN